MTLQEQLRLLAALRPLLRAIKGYLGGKPSPGNPYKPSYDRAKGTHPSDESGG